MPHDVTLISTIAAAMGLGLGLGLLAVKLNLPPLVGYLAAGVAIGPFTPGFVGDVSLAGQLAEIGVMLLMFGVGLHFSMQDLMSVRRIAVPGAILQIASATLLGAGIGWAWGWSLSTALLFGLSLSVASTVVLLRALESRGILNTHEGRVAVGWLVVEDLVMVLALVLIPALAGAVNSNEALSLDALWPLITKTLLQIGGFVAFMLLIGRQLFPAILAFVARTGSRELFTLCVVAAALGIAYAAAKLFGVSFALGAFFAGVVLRESHLSHRAAEDTLPLRDAFAVLFFVSVGMLFDPRVLLTHPVEVGVVIAIILIGKSIAALLLTLAMRYPLTLGLTVAASLAQIGEFSFILVSMGQQLNLMDKLASDLVLAGAIFSIALNPLLFKCNDRFFQHIERHHWFAKLRLAHPDPLAVIPEDTPETQLRQQVVIVGCGAIGRRVLRELTQRGLPCIAVDENRELVERLRSESIQAVAGDAAEPGTLIQAHIMHASVLVVAISGIVGLERILDTARQLNPAVRIVVRSHGREESSIVSNDALTQSVSAEHALASAIVAAACQR